jgi:hypothetical protein
MRDPVVRIDPETEAAIDYTRRLLERVVRDDVWKADYDPESEEIPRALHYIAQNSPDWVKAAVAEPLWKASQKRTKKPTRHTRDFLIGYAAWWLGPRYLPSRNDATKHIESASSIILEVLRRLGEKAITEKQIAKILRSQLPKIERIERACANTPPP